MIQKAAGGDQHVAFTRILHRSEPDVLMAQVAYHSHAPSACINVVCLADSANILTGMLANCFAEYPSGVPRSDYVYCQCKICKPCTRLDYSPTNNVHVSAA